MTDTELKLRFWRRDHLAAERLAATILHIEGFSSVDPQCPLGGRDGLKDVLCEKNGWKYVVAVYFPTRDKQFREIKKKFIGDIKGVSNNSAQGIVFVTNQALTPAERETLGAKAEEMGHKSIIYHLERLRAILDAPSGYGARLEFLDIDMSREEQLSFFSQWNRTFSDLIQAQSLIIIRELGKKIDALADTTDAFGAQLKDMGEAVSQSHALLVKLAPPSDKSSVGVGHEEFSTQTLSVAELRTLHRALLFDAPSGVQAGELRTTKLWLGAPGSTPETASFVPPDPEHVPQLLEELLARWRSEVGNLAKASIEAKISAIARFHHEFVSIHPFTDGNGRIARFLLSQQARELLRTKHRIVIEDRRSYFDALAQADNGDYSTLQLLVAQAITGTEFLLGSLSKASS